MYLLLEATSTWLYWKLPMNKAISIYNRHYISIILQIERFIQIADIITQLYCSNGFSKRNQYLNVMIAQRAVLSGQQLRQVVLETIVNQLIDKLSFLNKHFVEIFSLITLYLHLQTRSDCVVAPLFYCINPHVYRGGFMLNIAIKK